MEKEISQEKTCENCGYYSVHYFKRKTRFIEASCGMCRKNKKKKPALCKYWEEKIINKEESRKSVLKALEVMAKRIEEIASILKDDE